MTNTLTKIKSIEVEYSFDIKLPVQSPNAFLTLDVDCEGSLSSSMHGYGEGEFVFPYKNIPMFPDYIEVIKKDTKCSGKLFIEKIETPSGMILENLVITEMAGEDDNLIEFYTVVHSEVIHKDIKTYLLS